MALLHPELIEGYPEAEADAARVAELTERHASGADFFVERLAEGVGTIAAAFYPRPVVVRLSMVKRY